MFRTTLIAAGLALATTSAASALPATSGTAGVERAGPSDIVLVKRDGKEWKGNKNWKKRYSRDRWDRRYSRDRWDRRYGYRGRHYHAGRYWSHRYAYRPDNWQTLGCISVGPLWYCP